VCAERVSEDGEMKGEGAMIFFVAFFVVMLVTFVLPSLPPGRELMGFLGISVAASASAGVPIATLLVGFFNGVAYGVLALFAFLLARWVPVALSRNKDR